MSYIYTKSGVDDRDKELNKAKKLLEIAQDDLATEKRYAAGLAKQNAQLNAKYKNMIEEEEMHHLVEQFKEDLTVRHNKELNRQKILFDKLKSENTLFVSEVTALKDELAELKKSNEVSGTESNQKLILEKQNELYVNELTALKDELAALKKSKEVSDTAKSLLGNQRLILENQNSLYVNELTALKDELAALKQPLNKDSLMQEKTSKKFSDELRKVKYSFNVKDNVMKRRTFEQYNIFNELKDDVEPSNINNSVIFKPMDQKVAEERSLRNLHYKHLKKVNRKRPIIEEKAFGHLLKIKKEAEKFNDFLKDIDAPRQFKIYVSQSNAKRDVSLEDFDLDDNRWLRLFEKKVGSYLYKDQCLTYEEVKQLYLITQEDKLLTGLSVT